MVLDDDLRAGGDLHLRISRALWFGILCAARDGNAHRALGSYRKSHGLDHCFRCRHRRNYSGYCRAGKPRANGIRRRCASTANWVCIQAGDDAVSALLSSVVVRSQTAQRNLVGDLQPDAGSVSARLETSIEKCPGNGCFRLSG